MGTIYIELRRRFMNYLFDETEGDEYKSVSFTLYIIKHVLEKTTLKII